MMAIRLPRGLLGCRLRGAAGAASGFRCRCQEASAIARHQSRLRLGIAVHRDQLPERGRPGVSRPLPASAVGAMFMRGEALARRARRGAARAAFMPLPRGRGGKYRAPSILIDFDSHILQRRFRAISAGLLGLSRGRLPIRRIYAPPAMTILR